MTGKQIIQERKKLNKPYKDMTDEEKVSYQELWCRDIINSILCYDGEKGLFDNEGQLDKYLRKYEDELGLKRVLELIEEQKADFAKAKVHRNVHIDDDGVSYNTIEWEDGYVY